MLKVLKQLFSPKNKDILKKVLFTLLVLFIFKLGTMIQVPGTASITKDLGFLDLLNAMGGGAFRKFSIFALGVMPYISASIITQLLQMDIIPYFSELSKQGNAGRTKINKINRYMGIAIAFLQGYVFSFSFLPAGSTPLEYMRISIILTAGTAFLLWLGDQITQKGIGNGVSLIIMAGIIMQIPTMFTSTFSQLVKTTSTQTTVVGILLFTLFVIVYLLIIVGVVFIQESERRIPIQYSNKTSTYATKQNYMPIKLNSAGVMPVIFASMVVSIPSTIAQFIKNANFTLFVEKYVNYTTVTGFIFYMILILFFTYFYTYMVQLKPDEMASDFQKQGSYIPGIRPGKETSSYIKLVLSRLTFLGALFLMVIAGLPIVFANVSNLGSSITIGGTGLLIVVGVALEVYNQLESQLLTRTYGGR